MAVQLPTVQRMNLAEPIPTGRVEARAPNFNEPLNIIHAAQRGLASSMEDAYRKYEKDAIDTETTNAINIYDQWYRTKLNGNSETGELGIIHNEGDPVDIYNQFDQEARDKREEILGNSRLSEKGQRVLTKGLNDRHNSLYASRLSSYGAQYDRFQDKVFKSAVDLEKQKALDGVALVDPTDSSSTIPMESNVGRIQALHLRHGVKKGTAVYAEEGTPGAIGFEDEEGIIRYAVPSESVRLAMAKDRSDVYYNVINNSIINEEYDKSKMLIKNLGHMIEPVNKTKIDAAFDKLEIKNAAYTALSKADGKSFTEQARVIKAMTPKELGVSPARAAEVKLEASKLIDTNQRYMEQQENRHQEKVYENMYHVVSNKMNSSEPYVNAYEMENDRAIKPWFNFIKPQQKKALLELVAGRNINSDPEAVRKMLQTIQNGTFHGMSPQTLQEMSVGLNQSDSNKFREFWVQQNADSESKSRARLDQFYEDVDSVFLQLTDNKVRGALTDTGKENLDEFKMHLLSVYNTIPWNATPEAKDKWLRENTANFVARKKAEQSGLGVLFGTLDYVGVGQGLRSFISDPRQEFAGKPIVTPFNKRNKQGTNKIGSGQATTQVTIPAPVSKTKEYADFNTNQRIAIRAEFERANGKKPGSVEELMDWYNGR